MGNEKSQAGVSQADWLDTGRSVQSRSIDFLYADPPFNTGSTKRTPPNAKKRTPTSTDAHYADSFGSPQDFIAWLRPRLLASISLLKPSALICLHVDWRTAHHVRLLLDDLLGADRFVNHLIWSYGLGGSSPRRFARKHDDLLLYSLHPDRYWFDPPRIPATSNRLRGQSKKATDVLDIPSINNMARERTGYPTQKPLALLDMLVRACCPPGGTVLDPCCGSGTTLVAAARAGRRAFGMDISPAAVALTKKRLGASERSIPICSPTSSPGTPSA
jgi:DNA modification methylase